MCVGTDTKTWQSAGRRPGQTVARRQSCVQWPSTEHRARSWRFCHRQVSSAGRRCARVGIPVHRAQGAARRGPGLQPAAARHRARRGRRPAARAAGSAAQRRAGPRGRARGRLRRPGRGAGRGRVAAGAAPAVGCRARGPCSHELLDAELARMETRFRVPKEAGETAEKDHAPPPPPAVPAPTPPAWRAGAGRIGGGALYFSAVSPARLTALKLVATPASKHPAGHWCKARAPTSPPASGASPSCGRPPSSGRR